MNRLVLHATLVQRQSPRYTPAGLQALDLSLAHSSTVSEDGVPRQVSLEIKAVAIGAVTQQLLPLAMGTKAVYAGFITHQRNGRGLLFHVTSVEPEAPAEGTDAPQST